MQRLRLLILLAVCFLMASDAWADDLGYVDCASHPESTPVFSKARQTPDSVGAVPCGERFTVLVYGFVFSRIQTKDGKVGYVYSNLISADRGGAPASQAAAARVPATNAPAKAPAAAQSNSAAQMDSPPVTTSPVPQKPAPAQAGPLFPTPPVPAVTASDMASARVQSASTATAPAQTAEPAKPASAPVTPAASAPAQVAPAPAASAQPAAPSPSQPSAPAQVETQPAPQPPAPQSSAPAQPGPLFPTPQPASAASDTTSPPASAVEPAPAPAASQPDAAQPAPVREASVRSSWERPVPGARQNFLLDLYSGYSFARFTSGGSSTNLNGGMGSFGYNLKPWLQIVGDSSYNFVTISGVKNTLYGNHFGGRFFYHRGARWGFTPFVEALVGGSRLDTSSATVKTSTNCLSYKAGGGIDIRVSRHWEIRVINVDYYRTTFGAAGYSATQNNYWASAGVVLRLFGNGASE